MSEIFSNQPVDRRAALKALAGAGLLALSTPTLHASENRKRDLLADILPTFTDESRKKLQSVLTVPGFSGQIPAAAVRELLSSEQKSISGLMLALLPLARSYSHPPISNYRVGVVARGDGGSLYLGFNIEFSGQVLGFAVHGEQAALSSAYMHGESGVAAVALTAAPCGHCRQFMNELSPEGKIEIVVEQSSPMTLSTLLPMAFGPNDLGRKQGAFPITEKNLSSVAPVHSLSSDKIFESAIDAARTSYAPYSESYSGVGIRTRSGRIFKGSYLENVAFNPSLSPLQTALVQLIVAGEEYAAISRVVLAEMGKAKISQKLAARAVLNTIAPSIQLETVIVESK